VAVNAATANMGPASGVSPGIGAGMPYAGAAGATGFGAVGAAGAAAAKSSIGGILGWLFGSLALIGALVAGGIALNNALNNHDTSSPYASVSAPYTSAGTGSTAGTNSSVSGNPWQNNTAQNNYTQSSTFPNTGFSTGNQITRTSDPIGVFRETYIHLGVPAATVDTLIAEADNEVTDCYEHMGTYFDLINQEKEALLEALDANSVKISDVDTVINDGYDQRLAAIALELEEVINLYKTKSENTDASKYFYNRKLLFDGELTMEELRIRLLKSDTARSGLVTSEMTAVSFYNKFFKSDEVFDELSVTEGPWQNSFNLYAFQKQFNSNQRAWFDSPAMNPSLKSLLKANASSDSLVNSEQYKALSNH